MTPPPILFSAEQIQDRVRGMARTIAAAPLRPDIAMPVLVGGFVFAADLLRALAWEGVPLDVEMIWLRSYGDKRVASAISMVAGPLGANHRPSCAGDRRRAGCGAHHRQGGFA